MPSKYAPKAKAHVRSAVRVGTKNSAAQPIGKGKKGSMKRMLYKAGMGKKALATWRASKPGAGKAQNKRLASAGPEATRSVIRGVRASRKATGKNPTTNQPKSVGTLKVSKPVSGMGKLSAKNKVSKVAAKVSARSGRTGAAARKQARKIIRSRG